jgi:hypothetical protein
MSFIAASLIGGGLAMAGTMGAAAINKSGNKGTGGGYDVVQMPQYSWTEGNQRLAGDFMAGNLNRIKEGKYPTYYQNALPSLRAGMADPLRQTYFGSPGTRGGGLYGNAMATGAMAGLKGKRAMTPGMQVLGDYGTKNSAIDQYLTKLGVEVTQSSINQSLNGILTAPKGPDSNIVNIPAQQAQPSVWGDVAQGIGNMAGSYAANNWGAGGGSTGSSSSGNFSGNSWGMNPQGQYVNSAATYSPYTISGGGGSSQYSGGMPVPWGR